MELYQDQYVNGSIIVNGKRDCCSRYEAMKQIFDKYNRPFTILDIGANVGYYSLRASTEYDAISVMVENKVSEINTLINLCNQNICKDKVIVLHTNMDLYKLKEISKCEHFDVVLALNVIHHFKNEEVLEVCETLTRLGDNLIVETPPVEDSRSCGQDNLKTIINYFNTSTTTKTKTSEYKEKTAFIIGGDKNYMGIVETCVKSLNKYSDIPVIVYGFDCKVPFSYPNMIPTEDNQFKINYPSKYGKDTSLFYAKHEACLLALDKYNYDNYIWLDGDCVVTQNIDSILNYADLIDQYPLCMRYRDDSLIHWRMIDGSKKQAGHGDEVGDILGVKRNNNFTVATGLFMFNKYSKPFLEEVLIINKKLIEIDSTKFADDMALQEERLVNALFWKYDYKKHLPITWVSKDVDYDFLSSKSKRINKKFDIMYVYGDSPLEFINDQEKILFYHGHKNITDGEDLLKEIKECIDREKMVKKEKIKLGEFKRHTSNTTSEIFWIQTPKSDLQWPYYEYEKLFNNDDLDVVKRLKDRGINTIESNFDSKKISSTRREGLRDWITGINLKTFIKLNGIYPRISELIEKLKNRDIQSDYKWDNTNNDLVIHNFILNGNYLHIIDFDDKLIENESFDDKLQLESVISELI
jgi:hypothetical protein